MSPRWTGEVRVGFTRPQLAFYFLVRYVVAGFCKLFWRVKIEGLENVPAEGAFILSPVHRSNIDTPLVALVNRHRRVRFMGKDSMWKYAASDWFFTTMGGFPVHRGTPDREALKACERLLGLGEPLVIFPEGTRKSGPIVAEVFEGPAYLSAKLQVPIVPVGIGGSEGAMPKGSKGIRPVKVTMIVGKPLAPPPPTDAGRVGRKSVKAHTEALTAELQRLFDAAQVKAGA